MCVVGVVWEAGGVGDFLGVFTACSRSTGIMTRCHWDSLVWEARERPTSRGGGFKTRFGTQTEHGEGVGGDVGDATATPKRSKRSRGSSIRPS